MVGCIRSYIKNTNEKVKEFKIKLIEPKIVFVTAFMSLNFNKHLAQLEIYNTYEKPLQLNQLKQILSMASEPEKLDSLDSAGVLESPHAGEEQQIQII